MVIELAPKQDSITPEKPVVRINYQGFLEDGTAELGTIIEGIKPANLFTFQPTIDDDKVAHVVVDYYEPNDPRLRLVTGYLHYHTKFERNVIVVGNGTHRALLALSKGWKVDVELKETPVEHEDNPFRITNLQKKYGDVFSGVSALIPESTT